MQNTCCIKTAGVFCKEGNNVNRFGFAKENKKQGCPIRKPPLLFYFVETAYSVRSLARHAGQTQTLFTVMISGSSIPQKTQQPCGRCFLSKIVSPSTEISIRVSSGKSRLLRNSLGRTMRPKWSIFRVIPICFMSWFPFRYRVRNHSCSRPTFL